MHIHSHRNTPMAKASGQWGLLCCLRLSDDDDDGDDGDDDDYGEEDYVRFGHFFSCMIAALHTDVPADSSIVCTMQ